MEANAGSIVTQVLVNLSPLEVGLRAAGAMVASFMSHAQQQVNMVMQSVAKEVDSSKAFNTSVQGYREIQYAAQDAEIGADDFNKMLTKMEVKLNAATDKSSELGESFSKAGLDVKKLMEGSSADAFEKIAEKISEIPNTAGRAAAAIQLLGVKPSVDLLNWLEEFAVKTKESKAILAGLKTQMSDIDASHFKEATDNVERLELVFVGIYETVGKLVLPIFNEIVDEFIESGTAGEWSANLVKKSWEKAIDVLKSTSSVALKVFAGLEYIALGVLKLSSAINTLRTSYEDIKLIDKIVVQKNILAGNDYGTKGDLIRAYNATMKTFAPGPSAALELIMPGSMPTFANKEKADAAYSELARLKTQLENPKKFGNDTQKMLEEFDFRIKDAKKRLEFDIFKNLNKSDKPENFASEWIASAYSRQNKKAKDRSLRNGEKPPFDESLLRSESFEVALGFATQLDRFGGGNVGREAAVRALQSAQEKVTPITSPELKAIQKSSEETAKNTKNIGSWVTE